MEVPNSLAIVAVLVAIGANLGVFSYVRRMVNQVGENSTDIQGVKRVLHGEPMVDGWDGLVPIVQNNRDRTLRHREELDELQDRLDPTDDHDYRPDGSATAIPPDILRPPAKPMNKRAKAASTKKRYAISKTVLQGLIIPMAVFAAQQATTGDYATAVGAGSIVVVAYAADLAIGLEAIPWEEDQLVDAAERLGANYENIADWANRKAYGD